MRFPLDDWQFYAVTAAMLWGAWVMYRAIVPRRRRGKRASLTIGGRKP
jgi:hypothetical protein